VNLFPSIIGNSKEMQKMDRRKILLDYITNEIMGSPGTNLNGAQDLLTTGILDSLGILQIVNYIEETLDIAIPEEDVTYENFHNINALVNYLKQY
jgi:acyl carrier protein